MVNAREKQVVDKYEQQGWKTVRCGAPDFLFLKIDNKGNIVDHKFVEVKSKQNELTYSQEIWKKILKKLGANYKVEII